jgi:polysaccharide biosynthesis protein PslE
MQFTVRDLLSTVFRYSRALALFCAVVVGAVLIFYSQTSKLYDSSAKIMISLGSEAQGRAEYLNGKNLQLLQREQQLHDEQQILESHEVLLTTAKWIAGDASPRATSPVPEWRIEEAKRFLTGGEPEPTLLLRTTRTLMQTFDKFFGTPRSHADHLDDMVQDLSKKLTVNAIFDSDALDVSFRYRDPRVAQTVLSLVIAAYLDHHIAVFQSAAESDLLKSQLDRSVNQYHDRLGEFSSYMTTHRVYNDDAQANSLVEQKEKLDQALNEALADSDSAAARLVSLKSIGASLAQFERYSTTEVRNKQREALQSKLNEEIVEEQALLNRHPVGSRLYQEEQSKLETLRHLLDHEPDQIVDQTEQRRSKASELVESQIIDVTEVQRGAQARIERLHQDQIDIDAKTNEYARDLKGFNALKLDLAFAKQESEQMSQAYTDSRLKTITSQNAITDISVIDAPTSEHRPASPKKQIVIAATAGMLVMGGLAVLLACIGLDTTMADSKTAEVQLGKPVVANFPMGRRGESASECPVLFTRDHRHQFARLYQTVRASGVGGKVILLTESSSGEGASLLGYGLARFLSHNAGEKAAFIDCTNNSITEPLSVTGGSVSDLTLRLWPGDDKSNAESAALAVVSQLQQEFAYVVIAAGAVKEATELLALSSVAYATFLIVEAAKTRRAAARHSIDVLHQYGFQDVRLILNKRIFYLPEWLVRFV